MTNKSIAEIRSEVIQNWDAHMANHYAEIQLNFLASLPQPESTIDRMVREAKSRLAVSIEANVNYELIQMKKSWASADELILKWRYQRWMGSIDYANALKTLRQKQREVRELNVEIGMHKSALNSTFGKMGARHPLDHYGFISPVKERTRSYHMPEKASKFGQWVQDTSEGARPGQMVWQDDRPDLAEPVVLEAATSYWRRAWAKLQLNSCY